MSRIEKLFKFNELLAEDPSLKLYFVRKDDSITDHMKAAADIARKNRETAFGSDDDCVVEISQEECQEIPKATLKKRTHIFCFDDFEGPAFSYVETCSNVRVFGVKTLNAILTENIEIPENLINVHNLAFKDLKICCSAMKTDKKNEVHKLVQYMCGSFDGNLSSSVTHLITESVASVKYENAAKNEISIMHPDWVKQVWKQTQDINFTSNGADPQFDRFKLPIFFNLTITTSGFNTEAKNQIKTNIEENGGRYSGPLSKTVDILIINRDHATNEKIKAAKKLQKMVLTPEWVSDSIEAGYALSFTSYTAKLTRTSTPEKNATLSEKFNVDDTDISVISMVSSVATRQSVFEETVNRNSIMPTTSEPDYKKVMRKLTIPGAKKAGNILDGLTVYLHGFANDEVNRLGKILCACGAVKVDELNDQVSHVLIGESVTDLSAELETHDITPAVVQIDWLAACIEQKSHVDESNFSTQRPAKPGKGVEPPSPASKRAMKSLSSTFKKPAIPQLQFEKDDKENKDMDDIISQYVDASLTASQKILEGKKVFLYAFDDPEDEETTQKHLESLGAEIVEANHRKSVDYVITSSVLIPECKPPVKSFQHFVTTQWLEDTIEQNQCVEISYYHKPLVKIDEESQFLKDENIAVSNYKGVQRQYIKHLVTNLGGVFKEELKRADQPILLCPKGEGIKFESALMWELAVLPVEWLLECYKMKCRVDEARFLIGNSLPSKNNSKQKRFSIVPSSQEFPLTPKSMSMPQLLRNARVDSLREGELRSISSSPMTPNSDFVTKLCADLPTPDREITKAVLLEMREKNKDSPRTRRMKLLLDSPGTSGVDSPMPQRPACMRPLEEDYCLRPNSSPNSQHHHKRKLDALDMMYIPPRPVNKRAKMSPEVETPPGVRRHEFYKAVLADYNSPDPRGGGSVELRLTEKSKIAQNFEKTRTNHNFETTENATANQILDNLEKESDEVDISESSLSVPQLEESVAD